MSFLGRHKRLFFIFLIFFFAVFFTAITIFILDQVGQKYFFDKLYYRKSARYGYVSSIRGLLKESPFFFGSRVKDLQQLVNSKLEVPPDTYTVALIGDSMMYGEGVLQEQRFGQLLEKKMSAVRPTRVFILALPGDSVVDNYAKFVLAEIEIHPNATVFGLVNNDLLFDTVETYPQEVTLFNEVKKNCLSSIYSATPDIHQDWGSLIMTIYKESFSTTHGNRCVLDHIAKRVSQQSDHVMTLTFLDTPTLDQFNDQMTPFQLEEATQLDTYAKAFAKYGIKNIFPHNAYGFAYHPVSAHEGHPSADTHEKYAQILFDEFTQNPQWGFVTQALE